MKEVEWTFVKLWDRIRNKLTGWEVRLLSQEDNTIPIKPNLSGMSLFNMHDIKISKTCQKR